VRGVLLGSFRFITVFRLLFGIKAMIYFHTVTVTLLCLRKLAEFKMLAIPHLIFSIPYLPS
jgi:hypothetical protein